jgi:hypothetical protein
MKRVFFSIALVVFCTVTAFSAAFAADSINNDSEDSICSALADADILFGKNNNTFKIVNKSGGALSLSIRKRSADGRIGRYSRKTILLASDDSIEMSIASLLPCISVTVSKCIMGSILFSDSSGYFAKSVYFRKIPVGTWVINSDDLWSLYAKRQEVTEKQDSSSNIAKPVIQEGKKEE